MKYTLIFVLLLLGCEDVHNHYYEYSDTDSEATAGQTASDEALWTDTEGNPITPPEGCEGAINFPDPVLEYKIRVLAGKAQGDLYFDDVANITIIENATVENIIGIDCLPKLTRFMISQHEAQTAPFDLSPLAGAQNLMLLAIQNFPTLSDISVLENLMGLRKVIIFNCPLICENPATAGYIQTLQNRGVEVNYVCPE